MRDDYWEQSTQPLTSLCFVGPLLVLYELGMVWLGPEAPRNGADVWLRNSLATLGCGQYCVLPLLTCTLLLGWHHLTRREWRFNGDILGGMVCESVLLGLGLLILAGGFAEMAGDASSLTNSTVAVVRTADRVPDLLSFLGAGIYEELLFRVLLLSGMIFLCRRVGVDTMSATIVAVFVTSILFASAHYRMFCDMGGGFTWYSFFFRCGAGSLFSVLFLRRGFGIAVGTHAVYDVLVATMS